MNLFFKNKKINYLMCERTYKQSKTKQIFDSLLIEIGVLATVDVYINCYVTNRTDIPN